MYLKFTLIVWSNQQLVSVLWLIIVYLQMQKICFDNLVASLSLRLFCGTLVHGLLRSLKGGHTADSLLAGGSLSGQLYYTLLDAVINCSAKADSSSSTTGSRRRGRGRGRGKRGKRGGGRGARGGGQGSTEDINNRFALLMSEEDSDDD